MEGDSKKESAIKKCKEANISSSNGIVFSFIKTTIVVKGGKNDECG